MKITQNVNTNEIEIEVDVRYDDERITSCPPNNGHIEDLVVSYDSNFNPESVILKSNSPAIIQVTDSSNYTEYLENGGLIKIGQLDIIENGTTKFTIQKGQIITDD